MQNELTPRELTNNELVMLDALAYYKQLSDDYIPTQEKGKIRYEKIEDFINEALTNKEYSTCFNDLISDEKNGMVDILYLVKQNPRLTRLEIVYPDGFKDDDENYKWKKSAGLSFPSAYTYILLPERQITDAHKIESIFFIISPHKYNSSYRV